MIAKTLAESGMINTYNVGTNDAKDKENNAKLNYAIQMQIESLRTSDKPGVNKKLDYGLGLKSVVLSFLPYSIPAFLLATYKQHRSLIALSTLAGAYLGFINLKYERKRNLNIMLLQSWNVIDPALRQAYTARDSRYIVHLLPKDKTWKELSIETKRKYRLF